MQSCLGCPQVRRCRCPNQKTIQKQSMSVFYRPTSIDFRQTASFSVHNAVQMLTKPVPFTTDDAAHSAGLTLGSHAAPLETVSFGHNYGSKLNKSDT